MAKNKEVFLDPTTEASSLYQNLERMSEITLLRNISREDHKVAPAVDRAITRIEPLVQAIIKKMHDDEGRLIYIGAGTSGRMGVLDAAEIEPTFGLKNRVIGIIAGGYHALWTSVEGAEDDTAQGWQDLLAWNISAKDVVIGIAASGTTPYTLSALRACKENGITTGCIVCNYGTEMAKAVDHPVEVVVGPEIIRGSTRMKPGTAQKLVLNMISTTVMTKLGRVEGNEMVCMRPSNAKLLDRGAKMVMRKTDLSYEEAVELLRRHEDVRSALKAHREGLLIKL